MLCCTRLAYLWIYLHLPALRELFKSMFRRDSFAHNTLLMSSATVWGIVIQFAFAPILSAIYPPEVYGQFSIYAVLLAVGATLISLGFSRALLLPRTDEELAPLLRLSFVLTVAVGALFSVLFAIFGPSVGRLLGLEGMDLWLRLAGLFAAISAIEMLIASWGLQQRAYRVLSKLSIPTNLGAKFFNVGYGLGIAPTVGGLILTNTLVSAARSVLVVRMALSRTLPMAFKRLGRSDFKAVLTTYRDYPLYMVWSLLLSQASNYIPALLFPFFLEGTREIGLFAYAVMLLELPTRVLGNGLSNVFMQEGNLDWENERERLQAKTYRMFRYLTALSAVTVVLVYLLAPPLFGVIFGAEWHDAGRVSAILVSSYGIRYISTPLMGVFLMARRESLQMVMQGLLFGLRGLGIVIPGFAGWGFTGMLIGFGVANLVAHAVLALTAFHLLGSRGYRMREVTLWCLVFCACGGLLMAAAA